MRGLRPTIALVLVLALGAALALASDARTVRGTIVEVDPRERTLVLELRTGDRWTFHWNEKTAFLTRPEPGLDMRVTWEPEPDGKRLALRVGLAEKRS